jgi:hypothetical protein
MPPSDSGRKALLDRRELKIYPTKLVVTEVRLEIVPLLIKFLVSMFVEEPQPSRVSRYCGRCLSFRFNVKFTM